MNKMFLHKDDLQTILQFIEAFDGLVNVELTCDDSSGIGSIIQAHLHHTVINGQTVTITKTIVDETSW